MKLLRGQVWFADLNPIRGSEQAGARPPCPGNFASRKRLPHLSLSILLVLAGLQLNVVR